MKDIGNRNATLLKLPNGELTFAEVASGCMTDEARSAFTRASMHLIVKQQLDGHCCDVLAAGELKRGVNRKVRREMAELMNVDDNEAFRLHHHTVGFRCKYERYRRKVCAIERELSKRHGLGP